MVRAGSLGFAVCGGDCAISVDAETVGSGVWAVPVAGA